MVIAGIVAGIGLVFIQPGPAGAFPPGDGGPYFLRNWATDMCVDAPGYGPSYPNAPINQYFCNHPDNQLFYFDLHHYNTAYQPVFLIRHWETFNLCLDLPGTGWVPAATKVALYHCATNDNQFWLIYEQAYGIYQIVNEYTGLCLDVPGIREHWHRPDIRLEVYHCRPPFTDDHEWMLNWTYSG